eukprot:scaffold109339_cov23-Tisochrysis_lutea.AAC.2
MGMQHPSGQVVMRSLPLLIPAPACFNGVGKRAKTARRHSRQVVPVWTVVYTYVVVEVVEVHKGSRRCFRALVLQLSKGDDQHKRPARSAEEDQAGGVYGPQGTFSLRQQVRCRDEGSGSRGLHGLQCCKHCWSRMISSMCSIAGPAYPKMIYGYMA